MLLTIDYLILNFKGSLRENKSSLYKEDVPTPFSTVKHQYGNKTFADVYDLFFHDEKIAVINSVPRSSIIDSTLVQIQFENHLFYTYSLRELGDLVITICDYFDIRFEGINRLDIAHDRNDLQNTYIQTYLDLIDSKKKLKGREKDVNAYMITNNGRTVFNGFTVGKRSSSRMLRIYNKTKQLQLPKYPKPYINDYFTKNSLVNTDNCPVWRYEYQLNSTFFTYLRERDQHVTYQIFDLDFLLQLIQMAEKNHFEIVQNTGKTETNKEKQSVLNDWDALAKHLKSKSRFTAKKITKAFEPSITIQKRLIKGLFRQYYINGQFTFIDALTTVVIQYSLQDWFYDKYQFYVMEFQSKEKLKGRFKEDEFRLRYYALLQ